MKMQSMLALAVLSAALAFGLSTRFVNAEDAGEPIMTPDAFAKASGEEIYRHVCQGCHMALPPQLANMLARMQTIQTCPRCTRLIYRKELLEQSDPAKPDEPAS